MVIPLVAFNCFAELPLFHSWKNFKYRTKHSLLFVALFTCLLSDKNYHFFISTRYCGINIRKIEESQFGTWKCRIAHNGSSQFQETALTVNPGGQRRVILKDFNIFRKVKHCKH